VGAEADGLLLLMLGEAPRRSSVASLFDAIRNRGAVCFENWREFGRAVVTANIAFCWPVEIGQRIGRCSLDEAYAHQVRFQADLAPADPKSARARRLFAWHPPSIRRPPRHLLRTLSHNFALVQERQSFVSGTGEKMMRCRKLVA